jgi:peptide chain release factor 1
MEKLTENELTKLQKLNDEFNELSSYLETVEVMTDNKLFRFYQKRASEIAPIVQKFNDYLKIEEDTNVLKSIIEQASSEEEKEFETEICLNEEKEKSLLQEIRSLLFDEKKLANESVLIEIKAKSTQSDFPSIITNMIENYCNQNELAVKSEMQKESVQISAHGTGAFEKLKNLSGVSKRVFRGNEDYATIVVLQLFENEIQIDESEFEIQTLKSGGAGGQHINKTESAVRVIHKPTGIVAKCEDERSQVQNKEKAIKLVCEKIMQKNKENSENNINNQRKKLENAIFSNTATTIFDFDRNKFVFASLKKESNLSDAISGKILF